MNSPRRTLITGRPGSGKTTAVQRVVHRLERPVGGFTTGELREGGRRVGFEIRTLDGERAVMAHVDLAGPEKVSRYGVDVSAVDRLGAESIRAAVAAGQMVVVDEIGPMELLSEQFGDAVREALEADVPFLGTVVARRHSFTDQLKSREDVDLITLDRSNRDRLVEVLVERYSE